MTNNWKSLNPYSTGSNSNVFLHAETALEQSVLILILLEVTQITTNINAQENTGAS